MKAICTRTRSRCRQTSLLDTFEAPPARSEPPPTSSTAATSSVVGQRLAPTTTVGSKQVNEIKRTSTSHKCHASNDPVNTTITSKIAPENSSNKRFREGSSSSAPANAKAVTTKKAKTTKPSSKISSRPSSDQLATLTVTPSPSILARNDAKKKSSVSPEDDDDAPSSSRCQNKRSPVTTPCKDTENVHLQPMPKSAVEEEEVSATPDDRFIDVKRQVTLDSRDARIIAGDYPPSFHQSWLTPHYSNLPKGVIDIDAFPHQCCPNALHSHAGYSWITSKRRCHCRLDADHCSGNTTTEVYMGTYGRERFGNGASLVNDGWRVEQWWLDLMGKMRVIEVKYGSDKRSKASRANSQPNATDKDSNAVNPLSLPEPLPQSVEEHLDYMSRQPELNVEMRAILMDWLVELSEEYKLDSETLYLSTTLVDRTLACSYGRKGEGMKEGNMLVVKDMLQCVGCACTLIASKLLEITPPTADDFVYISDNSYNRKNILDMEEYICNALKFNLNIQTPYHYFERFSRASRASSESSLSAHHAAMGFGVNNAVNVTFERLVMYLLDLSTLEYKFVCVKPSLITASAVYLARATLGIREPIPHFGNDFGMESSPCFRRASQSFWSKTLEYYTGYDVPDLEEVVKSLRRLQESAETSRLKSIFNKHKSSKYMKIALRPVLNESELGFFF